MANAKTKTTKTATKNQAATKAKAKADQAAQAALVAAQAAQADLLVAMAAKHAARKPAGKGPRHGRHAQPRMPGRGSVINFAATVQVAIAAAQKAGKLPKLASTRTLHTFDQKVIVLAAHGTWVPFAKTWLTNQHGWQKDQTCARCAVALGFAWAPNMANTGKVNPSVTLRPVDPVAFVADPAGYVAKNLAAIVGGAQ